MFQLWSFRSVIPREFAAFVCAVLTVLPSLTPKTMHHSVTGLLLLLFLLCGSACSLAFLLLQSPSRNPSMATLPMHRKCPMHWINTVFKQMRPKSALHKGTQVTLELRIMTLPDN